MGLEKQHVGEFCKQLQAAGWKEAAPRPLENMLQADIFREKVKALNKGVFEQFSEEAVFSKLDALLQTAEEVKILDFLKFGATVAVKKGHAQVPLVLKLVDWEHVENNAFVFIREQEYSQGPVTDRPDVTLFVNGMPLAIVEGKDPLKPTAESQYWQALEQIMRYQKEISGLFRYVQFGVALGERAPYIPTFPRKELEKPKGHAFWKEKGKENIHALLAPETFLEFTKDFMFFSKDEKGNRIKIAARYMQYTATNRAVSRIAAYLDNKKERNRGLVWHWQGSGKTYTMFFIAQKMLSVYQKRKPLIFFTIDRLELQEQLDRVLQNIEHRRFGQVKMIESVEQLQDVIDHADKEWGLRIVTIHKFQPTQLDLKKRIDKREVLFLIDEAHRTQYGDLAAAMRNIFQKGIFLGFTGTPIFKKERNTFTHFSYPPEELYLDTYFIQQSEEDGFTLPIRYRVVEEKDVKILLNPEEIKTIIENSKVDPELVEKAIEGELAKDTKNKMSRKLTKTKVFLTNEKRVEEIVKYIKSRIGEDTENHAFKAMIVAANREACVLYKKIMDKYFPADFSEVVMSYQHNEKKERIHSFERVVSSRWNAPRGNDANAKITETFLKKKDPKVLIVTNMLLTGFDAPRLKVMYLDKPILYHTLLQAIARINRPLPEKEKKRGLVVDSIGLVHHLQETLGLYEYLATGNTKEIEEDLKHVFESNEKDVELLNRNVESIKSKLATEQFHMEKVIKSIKNNEKTVIDKIRDKVGYFALRHETDESIQKLFMQMKETLLIYKSLGAEPRKMDVLWEIKIIGILYYNILKKIRATKRGIPADLWDSVVAWIQKSTIIDDIQQKIEKPLTPGPARKLLLHDKASAEYYLLRNRAEEHLSNPLYKEIYERLERLRDTWIHRNLGIEEVLKELKRINTAMGRYDKVHQKPSYKKIADFVKLYVEKDTGEKIDTVALENKLKEVFKTGRFLETDRKTINLTVARHSLKLYKDQKRRRNMEQKMMEMIIGEVKREL